MKICEICDTTLRGCVAIAIVALLLASPASLRADYQKDKKKAKTVASPTSSTGSNSGAGSSKSGSGASGNTGGANTAGSSGGTHNTTDSEGAQKTRRARANPTGDTGGSSTTGNSGGTHKEKKAGAGATSGDTGTTSATGNSGGTHKEKKAAAGATTGDTGATSATGNSGGTHKEKKAAAGATSGDSDSTGDTSGTKATDKAARRAARNAVETNTTTTTGGAADSSGVTHASRKAGKARETDVSPNRIATARIGITRGTNGKVEVYRGHNGSGAVFRRDGTVREVRARDMTIIHLPGGSRRIVVDRSDHSRVVAYRGGYGYVQRPFVHRGHEFASRTYLYHGRPYAAYYQRYPYRGIFLEGYRPYRYYGPAFYGWAYNPWRSPVRYTWGWAGNPWYGYYGGYFTPYPVYSSASFWLTDYFIAASLQAAYQQRADNRAYLTANSGDPVVLTPEIKEEIANEVQTQLALENSESQMAVRGDDLDINTSGLPRILAEASPTHPRIFVVAGPLEVTDNRGQECGLTAGDVLRLTTAPPPDATSVYLQVFASKNNECPRGTTVLVELADLQEMQNNMRASIDQGLQELQSQNGGLPAPPPAAAGPPVQASFAPIAPPADPNVSSELQQQAREADLAEQGVLNEAKREDDRVAAGDPSTRSDTPVEISLGQTTAEVVTALGNPKRIVNLGAKKIYVYSDIKITFTNGKVTNVE